MEQAFNINGWESHSFRFQVSGFRVEKWWSRLAKTGIGTPGGSNFRPF
jgi:hypothetical protein